MVKNLLYQYGFDHYIRDSVSGQLPDQGTPARVISQHKASYQIVTESGEYMAQVSGKYHFQLEEKGGYPAVGDYVLVNITATNDRAVIQEILLRKTLFYRKDGWSKQGIQILAANFDTLFICSSLNRDFNVARLERYMIMAKESKARVAIILTKADLCTDSEEKKWICEALFHDVSVHIVSSKTGSGLEQLSPYFQEGQTVLALGSSGVGKSSLINALAGYEIMKVGEIGNDDKGRHTTVHRQMIIMPDGGIYLDTPGIREIGIVDADESVSDLFSDIEELGMQCKFTDCQHMTEPGCAIRRAIQTGQLSEERYMQYLQLKKEISLTENRGEYMFNKWQASKERSRNFRNIRKNRRR